MRSRKLLLAAFLAVTLSSVLFACGWGTAGLEAPFRIDTVTPSGDFSSEGTFADDATGGRAAPQASGVAPAGAAGGRQEPGQKFDRPKEGRMPGSSSAAKKSASAGSTLKPAATQGVKAASTGSAPGKTALSGSVAAGGRPASAQPAIPPVPVPAVPAQPVMPPVPVPAVPAQPVIPPVPVPAVPAQPAVSAPPPVQAAAGLVPSVQNQGSAVPEGVRATAGGQAEAARGAAPQGASAPSAPIDVSDEIPPAPAIGKREEVVQLPPVPTIGRIMPPLVPGVPPDSDVSASTLPAPEYVPQADTAPPQAPSDAFGGIIPNFIPPAPSGAEAVTGDRLAPPGGAPAGQGGL